MQLTLERVQRHRDKKPQDEAGEQPAALPEHGFDGNEPTESDARGHARSRAGDDSAELPIEERLELPAAALDALARSFYNEVARAGGVSQSDQRRRDDARQLSAWAERALERARRIHDQAREPRVEGEVTRLRLV